MNSFGLIPFIYSLKSTLDIILISKQNGKYLDFQLIL